MSHLQKSGEATALDQQVDQALTEITSSSQAEIQQQLSNLKITGTKEVNENGLRVVIISVPYRQISACRNLQGFLIPELEKKIENSQIVFVGKRRTFPKEPVRGRRYRAIRPTGRTLRAVNEALLDDVVYPTSIVGKRIHYDLKGGQTTHVFLDHADKTRVEERLKGFAIAYKRLTGLNTVFEVSEH